MLLEWADGLQSGRSEVEWMDGYPLDCYDNKIICGANKARATAQDLHNLYVIVYM